MQFIVEVTLSAVENDDWSLLYGVIDAVPGTIAIEDADEPRLLIPVEADSPMRAATFVDGLSQLMGFSIVKGSIYEPDDDFEDVDGDDSDGSVTDEERTVREWVDAIPPVRGGALVDA